MGLTENLIYDGLNLRDFGAYVFAQNVHNAPTRMYESITVPGKSGDLLIDTGRYENVNVSYGIIWMEQFQPRVEALRNALISKIGYKRLETTRYPEEYYSAVFRGAFQPKTTPQHDAGKMVLEFERKPQRFLKSGEFPQIFTQRGVLNNPEDFESQPLIRIYGNGAVVINGAGITVSENEDNYVDIDCDIKDAYRGSVNCNNIVVFDSGEFPSLTGGENQILFGGVSRVEITPRWWRL